jgi:F-type H+-transporting ATPase subunit b
MTTLAFAESIQLVPDGTIVLHIAIIITMVFVLNKLLFKPINNILEEREHRTRGRSGEARETIRRVDESLANYENSLRKARAEGYRLLEQKQTEAFGARQQKIGLVRQEVEQQIQEEKGVIRAQADEARATLEGEAARIAAGISSQILGR